MLKKTHTIQIYTEINNDQLLQKYILYILCINKNH